MSSVDVTATALKGKLAEIVERASHGTRYRIMRHGRVQGAIVSAEDLEQLQRLEDARDLRAAARVRKKGAKPIPLNDVLRDLGL